MSNVLVVGGTGALGRQIVPLLRAKGHEVRVLSRRAGAGTHVGDLTTGEGLAAAVDGVDSVIHAASDFRKSGRLDPKQTENLLAASGSVGHFLYVSIVGIEHFPLRYYRNKVACENLVLKSAVPHTILRATQFHELIGAVLRAVERWPIAPLPTDFRFQPVATEDVAARIADLIAGQPLGRAPDIGGPEVFTLAELAQTWRASRPGPRRILRTPLPGRIARAYREGRNTCPDHADGTRTWSEYVAGNPSDVYFGRS
ncbi:NAD(P)H-binding protein [Nocardia puris]|uniref:SDR family oxidoreductase n=1 Tax=Nocardia puris TaxID=208602 RepID=UPI00189363D5|nr:NAD(P)H-binding protein [Nocardia puris]MBF6214504.1 NAD(P)H-binding protein [Nocardia puris]MBF6365913.1 NAD(P)H-binding protein [Nocardia puris]MBF6460444.1 NAD(P)H-binding protein [Nocardia puris]